MCFLALSSADRGLFVSEGGWGEREKKRVLAIFRLLSGSLCGEEIVLG